MAEEKDLQEEADLQEIDDLEPDRGKENVLPAKPAFSSDKDAVSFLIFSVEKKIYAIDTSQVQEIVHDAKVHPLPFVPYYIEGIINYGGKPCTAINPSLVEGEAKNMKLEGNTFLVFKRTDDVFSLHISAIEIFYEVLREDLDEDQDWESAITYRGSNVELFDPDIIADQLKKDLGA